MSSATGAAAPAGRLQPAGTAALAVLSVVTAISFCRIFPDWAYMGPMLVVVLGAHAACAALRSARLPVWVAIPLATLLVFELVALVYYRDTMRWLVPSGDTLDFVRTDLRLVWDQFPRAVTPVPSEGSFAMATAALLAMCAVVADAFAFRAFGRAEAVVPTGVVFVFTSALGTDRNRVAVAALWVGAAVLAVAVLRFTHAREESAWMGTRRRSLAATMPATFACASLIALGAGVLAPRLPGAGEEPLLDTSNGSSSSTEIISPLVDIRSRLVNRSNVQVFTVKATTPQYWRLIGLGRFDGTTWTAPDEDLLPAAGVLTPSADGVTLPQVITISRLGGTLVPAAFTPAVVQTADVSWAAESQTLVVSSEPGLLPNDVFNVTSVLVNPSADLLRGATVGGAPSTYYELPDGFPDEARDLAREATAGATTPFDQALMLQNWFRSNFEYDLTVQRGHSDDAIRNFLRIRRGYCEQFAGTFAAMARSLGLPARVAVGFTQGEQQADGLYHVFGRQAHAWPEVWFDGIGWVIFEPTPGRGAPGAEGHTGVAPQQATGANGGNNGNQPDTPTVTAPPVTVARPVDDPLGTTVPGQTTTTVTPVAAGGGGSSGPPPVWSLIALGGLLLVGWVVLMPRVVRRWARRSAHTPIERVVAAWRRTCDSLFLAGAPPQAGATPVEYARRVPDVTGVDVHTIGEMARNVTRAIYSPRGVDETIARRCEQLQEEIDATCREHTPWTVRLMAHFDPRLAMKRS